tara:strand:+ start:1720 stop:3525 length:1806 start_codon:yes stop_codon:yes gene_type:complete
MRLILVFLLTSSFVFSQQSNQQIAYQYYINGEYKKAISIYKELIQSRFSVAYYSPYFQSLFKIKDYNAADALARKFVKKYPTSLTYQIEVGVVQEKLGNIKKADRIFKKAINQIDGNRAKAINVSNTFIRYGMFERALNVYVLSEKINPKNNFGTNKAQLYSQLGNSDLMIIEYLSVLERDPRQKQFVISNIQKFMDNDGIKSDKNFQLVKKALLPFVRNENARTDFTEMLIWLFMQNHQFKMALTQAKALDRRLKAYGEEVYDLAESFLDKGYYDLAIEAYEHVIKKGKSNFLYIDANINKLFALTKQLDLEKKNISELDNLYQSLISELGKNSNTVLLLSNFAHFKAFYLHDLKSAEFLLLDAMQISGVDNYDLAECKLEYADIQLLMGNIWESLLYYSQVEKDFKEHPIGHEAKLRRAKVAYYQGDFQWAQAQLETLKASTSKLIANDAMELSLIITDNYNLDTTEIAMSNFSSADLLNYQQRYTEAIKKYDAILSSFSGHTLSDEIFMRKAEIFLKQGKLQKALLELEKIEDSWDYDILADDAVYMRAQVYDFKLQDTEKAMLLYEKILLEHSGSVYVEDSRNRYRELRGDNINNTE